MKGATRRALHDALLSRLSLRGFLLVATGVTAALALAATVALVGYVGHYRSANRGMRMAIDRLQAAEQIQADLLAHHQQAGLSLLSGPQQKEARLRSSALLAARIGGSLELAHRGELAEPEGRALQSAERALARYLSVHRQLELDATLSPLTALRQLNSANGEAYEAVKNLIDLDIALSAQAHSQARFGQTAAVAASAIVLLLMATLAVVMRVERSWLFRPLLALEVAMSRFGKEPFRPAPEEGTRDLRELTRAFNAMGETIVRNREAQLGYLSGVAHDLRNPLSALKTAAGLLAPGRRLPSEERIRELAAILNRQVDRLDRMVGDLLDSTRIEAGRLELRRERHDLRALAAEAVELFRTSAPTHRLELEAPASLGARIDSLRISQVLNNLVSNAIKYSPQGGPVRVEVGRQNGWARLRVRDEGLGIPAGELESIFEPFRRSSATRDGIPGVGLGLSVSRRIVEAHGGRIEVESAPGRGSCFTVWLPLEPVRQAGPIPVGEPEAQPA